MLIQPWLQRGAGRAQGSLPLAGPKLSLPHPLLAVGGGSHAPAPASQHGPNASALTRQSIPKSRAARPRKSNYSSQPCAPAHANRAALPWTLPHIPGCQAGRARLFPSSTEDIGTSEGEAAPNGAIPLQLHPQPPALHDLQWDFLPKGAREGGGRCPGDEGQRAELISPSCDVSHEWRGRRE